MVVFLLHVLSWHIFSVFVRFQKIFDCDRYRIVLTGVVNCIGNIWLNRLKIQLLLFTILLGAKLTGWYKAVCSCFECFVNLSDQMIYFSERKKRKDPPPHPAHYSGPANGSCGTCFWTDPADYGYLARLGSVTFSLKTYCSFTYTAEYRTWSFSFQSSYDLVDL